MSCAPALAQTQRGACPPYSNAITVNFATDNAPTTYNNALNVTGLQNMARLNGGSVAGKHQRALGLTTSQMALSIKGQTSILPITGGYCVYLNALDANFGYRRMDVLIASEFRPGSCEYKTILDHENQHVAINRNTIKEYAPLIRQEMERQLQTVQPRFTRDAQAGSDEKIAAIQNGLSPLLDQVEAKLTQRNGVIDNDNNYAAIAELCKNWDQGNVWPVVPPATKN